MADFFADFAARYQDTFDDLTGLRDAESFVIRAPEAVYELFEEGYAPTALYFNVVNLKAYNAHFGFLEGDKLLAFVAHTIRDAFPERLIGRVSDDRFMAIVPSDCVTEKLQYITHTVQDYKGGQTSVVHVGVYTLADRDESLRVAGDKARTACETLKGNYDQFVCWYTDELGDVINNRSHVLDHFAEAIEKEYIRPYYQPIVRCISDKVSDFEVLARWGDPEKGLMSPSEFIPALEDARIIHLMDLHIIDCALRDQQKLLALGFPPCRMSINLSRIDFQSCDIVSEVAKLIEKHGTAPELISIELTESSLSQNFDAVGKALAAFSDMGIEVWMDDFGTGYSSLNVLREFSFDLVKFDMSFLHGLNVNDPADPGNILLINLISMVKDLGMHTLIEGVESIDQLVYMRNLGCEKVQGYIFSKPMPYEQLVEDIESGKLFIEDPEWHNYFQIVGNVNMRQPISPRSTFDPTGLADGIPVAVLEYNHGRMHYLMHNRAFVRRLMSLGIPSIEASERMLNETPSNKVDGIRAVVPKLLASSDWQVVEYGSGSTYSRGYAQRIVVSEDDNVCAFRFFVPPIYESNEAIYKDADEVSEDDD